MSYNLGSELILRKYEKLTDKSRFRVFPSIRFKYFLTLLKNAQFMIGNSSAGIRETCVYGVPLIYRKRGSYYRQGNSAEMFTNITFVSNTFSR